MGKALVIRHRRDGTTTLSGGAEDGRHSFAAKTIAREVAAGHASVTLTLQTADGPVMYELDGFEPVGDEGRVNARVWHMRRVEREGAAK